MARTIMTRLTGLPTLKPADAPLTITASGGVSATGSTDAIDGPAGTTWSITDFGRVSAAAIAMSGSTAVTNGSTIGGVTGVDLKACRSVNNAKNGIVSGAGGIGSGPSVGSADFADGGTGSVNNIDLVSGGGYGAAPNKGSDVTISDSIDGDEHGAAVHGMCGNVKDDGSIAAADDGIIDLEHLSGTRVAVDDARVGTLASSDGAGYAADLSLGASSLETGSFHLASDGAEGFLVARD